MSDKNRAKVLDADIVTKEGATAKKKNSLTLIVSLRITHESKLEYG